MSLNSAENIDNNDISNNSHSVIELQLGDIIKMISPNNQRINDIEFFINYIDSTKMFLLNPDTGEITKLKISPHGIIGDGSIKELIILSRSDNPSYAIQNGLLPGKWINIHFGGDNPVIITGEISNLENDMIEITTTDKDVIYINFDYKGIPEDLPIEFIEIREKPQSVVPEKEDIEEMPLEDIEELEKEHIFVPTENINFGVQSKNIKNALKEMVIRADQIKFGNETLGKIKQFVDVEKDQQRYSIDEQVSDLLDDLLSTVPNSQRTQRVLNNIHIIIERFKQLREYFSTKDEYGTVNGVQIYTAFNKPLKEYFKNFKQNLFWILPVIQNTKKVYNVNVNEINEEYTNDVDNIDIDKDIESIMRVIDNYKSSDTSIEELEQIIGNYNLKYEQSFLNIKELVLNLYKSYKKYCEKSGIKNECIYITLPSITKVFKDMI